MFRTIVYLLAAILLITILRLVIGYVMRGASEVLKAGDSPSKPGSATAGGELIRDPVCGTYVAAATSFKQSVRGQVYHFCSRECRERFIA